MCVLACAITRQVGNAVFPSTGFIIAGRSRRPVVANPLESWPRPYYQPNGGNPLLLYVVFGEFDLARPLSRSKYRAEGLPEWMELVRFDRANRPEVFAEYQSGKLWEIMSRDMPFTAREAEQAPQCVALRGEPADPPTLDYFRDAIGILTWLLDAGGTSIYDPQMMWLWSADEWREEAFEPAKPQPHRHAVILVSEEGDGTTWYHTRGMRKFGRPDLSVHGVGAEHATGITDLIDRFMEHQALGAIVAEGQEVRMNSLPPGGVCRHSGSLDDLDFNNVHIEIVWPDDELRQSG